MNLVERQAQEIIKAEFSKHEIKPPTKLQQIKDNLTAVGGKLLGWLVFDVPAFVIPTAASYIFLSHLEPFKSQPNANLTVSILLGFGAYRTVLDVFDIFTYEMQKSHSRL